MTEDSSMLHAFWHVDGEWQSMFLYPDGSGAARRSIPVAELIEIILELEEVLKGRPEKPSERH